jgi:hypothetical protein
MAISAHFPYVYSKDGVPVWEHEDAVVHISWREASVNNSAFFVI